MSEISRRQFIGLGGAALLLTGCTERPGPVPSLTPVPSTTPNPSPRPTASPTQEAPDWAALTRQVRGAVLIPGHSDYDTARLVQNPRYDNARPLAILTAASAADVAAGIAFARNYRMPLAVRSGGHSYPGWSAGGAAGTGVRPSLVIDTRGLARVAVSAAGSARVGAGASLAQVYSVIGGRGRALAAGSCATVGIAGLALGGGVGVLVRAYGLTCDALTELDIVTADGVLRTASTSTDPDLFWACRGGGGGHLGVVTSLTFATHPAPTVTTFSLRWPFAQAAAVVAAWQAWAPHADRELWSTLKLLNGARYTTGPGIFLSGTWIGAPAALPGALAPLLQRVGTPPSSRGSSTHSYLDAMMGYAGCRSLPLPQCTTAPGGKLTRESAAAASHIAYSPLTAAGISTLLSRVVAARSVPGIREGGVSLDALGGAVADLAPDATAFPHRRALMTVQYTATFENGRDPSQLDAYVRGFRSAMEPHWGHGAYVNYADPSLKNPASDYFADNAPRLARLRRRYDPDGVFSQPQAY